MKPASRSLLNAPMIVPWDILIDRGFLCLLPPQERYDLLIERLENEGAIVWDNALDRWMHATGKPAAHGLKILSRMPVCWANRELFPNLGPEFMKRLFDDSAKIEALDDSECQGFADGLVYMTVAEFLTKEANFDPHFEVDEEVGAYLAKKS